MRAVAALLAGVIFGVGLSLSGMTDPRNILGFLDLAGAWRPTLGFVMAGALSVTIPGFAMIRRRRRPILGPCFFLPQQTRVDPRLLAGAAIFGIGWGIAGYCPGPAVVSLGGGAGTVYLFAAAMIGGMRIADWGPFNFPSQPTSSPAAAQEP